VRGGGGERSEEGRGVGGSKEGRTGRGECRGRYRGRERERMTKIGEVWKGGDVLRREGEEREGGGMGRGGAK